MRKEMRLLPIEAIAPLTTEREAMRLCLDTYNDACHDSIDMLTDPQWAALLNITKGQLSEYLGGNGDKPKHIPEIIREKVERLTGIPAITQYHALKKSCKLVPIDDNEQMRLKDAEIARLKSELENKRIEIHER